MPIASCNSKLYENRTFFELKNLLFPYYFLNFVNLLCFYAKLATWRCKEIYNWHHNGFTLDWLMDIVKILWRSVMGALVVSLVGLVSCGHHGEEDRLGFDRIDELCDSVPEVAISMLDSIDYGSLTEKERHHYDLLRIRALDKAYVIHTSDSLIRDVIDYYSRHKESPLWPVALYYGGRVYSDLGDYPTALEYFRNALAKIPENTENLAFRANILSQTGRLLEELRLYSEAVPYLEKSIILDKELNDSAGIVYDRSLLSTLYENDKDFVASKRNLMEAIRYSDAVSDEDRAWINVHLASLLLIEDKKDSALNLVRANLPMVDSIDYNYTLACASEIYQHCGIIDTAYMYAMELVGSDNFNNRIAGYDRLFSKEIINMVPRDSLHAYMMEYKQRLDDYLDQHEAQEALISNSKYNYALHLREREKAEQSRSIMAMTLAITILCFLVIVLYYKVRAQKNKMKLRMAENIIERMLWKTAMAALPTEGENAQCRKDPSVIKTEIMQLPFFKISDKNSLKSKLLEKFNSYNKSIDVSLLVDERLRESEIVNTLYEYIKRNTPIETKNTLIRELEEAIDTSSPDFKAKMSLLSDDKMSRREYEVALFIRAGIAPKDIAVLLGRTKSTITDRRTSLAKKIFWTAGKNNDLDKLILLI